MIDLTELKQQIEAILFAAGRAVTLAELCTLCKVRDPALVQEAVQLLKHDLKARSAPLLLTDEADGWKMTVGEKHLSLVREITPHMELSKALLETLAVIAWKQPLLQSAVVKIRTSGAYEHIAELLKLGFISKTKQGRSYALKVTGKFFEYFDLPGHDALKAEFEKIQGTAEMQKIIGEQTQLGGLPVYNVPLEQQVAGVAPQAVEEPLGKLEVYDEPAPESPIPAVPQPNDTVAPEELAEVLQAESGETQAEEPEAEEPAPEAEHQAEPSRESDAPRKLSAALESFAEEGKAEWGKGEKKEEAEESGEPETTADDEEKSGLDEKL